MKVGQAFYRYLDSRGDGTGVKNAIGDYADNTVTFDNTTNILTLSAHGFVTGDGPFTLTNSGGALPAELAIATDYFVGPNVNANDFELSLTRGGDAIPFTDDGTGTHTLVNPFLFYLAFPSGQTVRISSLIVLLEDASIAAATYGAVTALSIGVQVRVEKINTGAVVIDLTDGLLIKRAPDWGGLCHNVIDHLFASGNQYMTAEIDFDEAGDPLRLESDERLVVTLNDDLGGLATHTFLAQGVHETLQQ